jgi:hypothetical protein
MTASGGGVQLGQEVADVVERGGASAGAGSGWAEARVTRARAQRNAVQQRRRTWPDSGGGVRQRRNTGGRERGRRRGPNCNFRKMQGPYCNASITFKPVLQWRWAQKQKCMVFQNVQLCFKVHLQKS